jgi:DNA-binding GntR family transcriptional regulator
VFSLRLQMEPAAAATGAKLAEAADHLAARQALERLNDALAQEEFSSSGQLNRSFHLQLVVPRLQPIAAEILSRLHTLAQRYVQAHLRPEGRVNRAAKEHAALLTCWCEGNSKKVRELMHRHIESTRDDLARAVTAGQKAPGP